MFSLYWRSYCFQRGCRPKNRVLS